MQLTAVLASALSRPALVLTWVCSSRRWLGTASCRPRYNPGSLLASVQGSTVHGSAISGNHGGGGDGIRTGGGGVGKDLANVPVAEAVAMKEMRRAICISRDDVVP